MPTTFFVSILMYRYHVNKIVINKLLDVSVFVTDWCASFFFQGGDKREEGSEVPY